MAAGVSEKLAKARAANKKYKSKAESKDKLKDLSLHKNYGLTLEDWDIIYEFQKGLCMLCGSRIKKRPYDETGKTGAVDHCHKTGLVRGLLCQYPCNRLLKDDVQYHLNALEYLTNPPATKALSKEHYTAPGRVRTKKRSKLLKALRLNVKPEDLT